MTNKATLAFLFALWFAGFGMGIVLMVLVQ